MARKILEYTVAGDASGLERAFARARNSTNQLTQSVTHASTQQGGAMRRMSHEATLTERSYHRLHETARGLIGITGLGGIAFGLKDVTEEALKAQNQQLILSRTVANAGISWHAHGKAIEESLNKMSLWSGVAKSDLTQAMGNAIRATGSLTGAHDLLTKALNVSAGAHVSFADAQKTVVRAYEGNTRGLKTMGIQVDAVTTNHDKLKTAILGVDAEIRNSHGSVKTQLEDQKRSLQALADQAAAQDKLGTRTKALETIQSRFHGDAQKQAQSTAGRFNQARQAITLAEEEIGSALLPALASGAKEIGKLANKFREHWPEIKKDITDTVKPTLDFAKGVGSFVSHHKGVADIAKHIAEIAVAYKAISKVGELTGLTRLLGLGGRAAGGLANPAGGVVSKVLGKANPIPVFVVNEGFGKPGGHIPGVPGVSGGPGGALARASLPRWARYVPGITGDLGAGDIAAAPFTMLGSTALVNQGLKLAGVRDPHRDPLSGLSVGGGTHGSGQDRTNTAIHSLASEAQGYGGISAAIRKTKQELRDLGAEEDKTARMGASDQALKDYDARRAALERLLQTLKNAASPIKLVNKSVADSFQALSVDGGASVKQMNAVVGENVDLIKRRLGTGTAAGAKAVQANFADAEKWVRQHMSNAAGLTAAGAREINKLMRQEFKALGISPKVAAGLGLTAADLTATTGSGQSVAQNTANLAGSHGFRGGGWIGSQGEAGGDNVPIVVGRGEAVLNRHQQGPVEAALQSTFGIGLGELFQKVTRPHFMASGGFAKKFARGGYSFGQLEQLWERAGGPRSADPMAAAIAMAESRGDPTATNHNKDGSIDRGLWQINSVHGNQSTYDPIGNAHAAVSISSHGRDWHPWSTFNNGAYLPFLRGGAGQGASIGGGGQRHLPHLRMPRLVTDSALDGVISGARRLGVRGANAVIDRINRNANGGPLGAGSFGRMVAFANRLDAMHIPYGPQGHSGMAINPSGEDCSSTVSKVLHAGGALNGVLDTTRLPGALAHGPGKQVTVFDRPLAGNAGHTIIKLGNRFFGTSGSNPGGGPGWIGGETAGYLRTLPVRLHPRGMASGGFAGGGPVASSAGLSGAIDNITSSGPAANGPKPKAPTKSHHHKASVPTPQRVTWAVDPYTHKYAQHSGAQWAAIRRRYATEQKTARANHKVSGFNSKTGREEWHTAAQWRQLRITQQVKSARASRRQGRLSADYQSYQDAINHVDQQVRAGKIGLARAEQIKRRIVYDALHGKFGPLTPDDRLAIEGDLRTDISPAADPTQVASDDMSNVTGALGDVDAHLAAGDYGDPSSQAAQDAANAAKHGIIQTALSGGFGVLSKSDQLDLRGQDYPLTHGSSGEGGSSDLADAMKALKASIDAQNHYAAQVTSVSLGQAWKALADVVSGQITGVGYQGRAAMAGSGAIARY